MWGVQKPHRDRHADLTSGSGPEGPEKSGNVQARDARWGEVGNVEMGLRSCHGAIAPTSPKDVLSVQQTT